MNSLGFPIGKKCTNINLSIQNVYDVYHNIDRQKCAFCDNDRVFITFKKGYKEICSNKECSNLLRKKTNKLKYGTDYPTQNKQVKEKISLESSLRTKERQKEITKKRFNTNNTKYGYKTPFSDINVQNRIKSENLRKYGQEYNIGNKLFKEKSKKSMLSKYGVDNYSKLNLPKTKVKKHVLKPTDINETFWKNTFIKNDKFMSLDCMKYHNISRSFLNKTKILFGIEENNEVFKASIAEEELKDMVLDSIKTKNIIKPLELDVYSEKHNLAIEYNGLMFHSYGESEYSIFNNLDKEDSYKHLRKTELCEDKGIDLLHIFEDEWLDKKKKPIWISIINEKQNLNTYIDSNDCTIKKVSTEEMEEFLDKNYLGGYIKSPINIGLYLNNKLLQTMSFTYIKNKEYSLDVLCNKNNFSIEYMKILSYFEEIYKPTSIIINIDRRFECGSSLRSLGFIFIDNTKPRCYYFNTEDKVLYKDNKYKNNIKYRRIWDSGTKIFKKTTKE